MYDILFSEDKLNGLKQGKLLLILLLLIQMYNVKNYDSHSIYNLYPNLYQVLKLILISVVDYRPGVTVALGQITCKIFRSLI